MLWSEYILGKQTYHQLALKYGCSAKTIQRLLDSHLSKRETNYPAVVNLLMDTTYFGKTFGVMVFKDSITKQILHIQFVKQETNNLYLLGVKEITKRGIKIQSIVCDGRKGLFQIFEDIPVQMCNFHQVAIVRKYLTKKPKMQASKELWLLTLMLVKTDRESFEGALNDWHEQWNNFLNERTVDEKGKSRYIHKRLRSAYRSLRTNMPYLFTWYDKIELKIPNTTNAIDGHFSDLKNKLRNHNGLAEHRKKQFIVEFFKA